MLSLNRSLVHAAMLALVVMVTAATALASAPASLDHDALVASADDSASWIDALPEAALIAAPTVDAPPAPAAPAAAPTPHPWIPAAEPAADSSGGGSSDAWGGSLSLYGFLSTFNGELRAGDTVVDVDRNFGDISDVLKFAAGVRFEGQYGKWGINFDNNYVHLGDDVETPMRIVPDYRFDVSLNVTEMEGTYRLYSTGSQDDPVGGPKFAIDALGGVRFIRFTSDIEIRRLIFPTAVRDASSTYIHGYLGNRIIASPSKYIAFVGRYNFSLASDFSWFLNGTVEFRPWEHFGFGAGYQVLDLSLQKDDKDTAVDAKFYGPVLSMTFHF